MTKLPCRSIPKLLDTVPEVTIHEPERRLSLENLLAFNWIQDEFPYLMMMPTKCPFYPPLFDQLFYRNNRFPIVREERGFILTRDTINMWEDLEGSLFGVVRAMGDICYHHLPKSFRYWAKPRQYGYTKAYRTKQIAQEVALDSRDAFVPLIATASLFFTMMDKFAHPPPGSTWREAVVSRAGVHHQFLSDLEGSVAGDAGVERVGGILHPYQLAALQSLFCAWNTCILVSWGHTSDPLLHRASQYLIEENLLPPKTGISNYISRDASRSPPSPPPASSQSPLKSPASFPALDPLSKQLPNETWNEFFLRRQAANQKLLQIETPVLKQARESRAKSALKQVVPGKRGAKVFVWEDVDGHRIRTAVSRKVVADIWEAYGTEQRRFDDFRDEWDLCSEFGENDPDSEDEDDVMTSTNHQEITKPVSEVGVPPSIVACDPKQVQSGEYVLPPIEHDTGPSPSLQPSPERQATPLPAPTDIFLPGSFDELQEEQNEESVPLPAPATLLPDEPITLSFNLGTFILDLQSVLDRHDAIPDEYDHYPFSDTLEERAYYWYGFHTPIIDAPNSSTTEWALCQQYLGNGRWLNITGGPNKVDPSSTTQRLLCSFFDALRASEKIDDMPSTLYDLAAQTLNQDKLLQVRSEDIEGVTHFFIRSRGSQDVSWEVELTNPVAVVEIFRRQCGFNLFGLVQQLLDRGIPFRTCITSPLKPSDLKTHLSLPPGFTTGLGYRPPGYQPDATDYAAYVQRRDEVLRGPRGRVALLQGGLISRLARGVVQYQHVFDGPTHDVCSTGKMHRGKNVEYWDDDLTEDEILIICGVYQADTGDYDEHHSQTNCSNTLIGNSTVTDLSWWPKPVNWYSADLNLGFWSEDCERWFQGQLQKINQAWRNSLKMGTSKKITQKNRRLCDEYLKTPRAEFKKANNDITVEQLNAQCAALHDEFSRPKTTRNTYEGYLRRGKEFLGDLVATRRRNHVEDSMDTDLLAVAFEDPPNKHSADAARLFLTHECTTLGKGKQTASGIQGAFCDLWDNINEVYGNPARSPAFRKVISEVNKKSKKLGNRHPAEAMDIGSYTKCMDWSEREFPSKNLQFPPKNDKERAAGLWHAQMRAAFSTSYTLWTRNSELTRLRISDLEFDCPGDDDDTPMHTEIHLHHRKGWQKKKDEDVYEIHSQEDQPALDADAHLRRYIEYRTLVTGKPPRPNEFLFPYLSSNGVIHLDRAMSLDNVQKMINHVTTSAGLTKYYTTHCFRRGGAQYRFIHASVRWSLEACRWWGGWIPEDESLLLKNNHGAKPATIDDIRALGFTLTTALKSQTASIQSAFQYSHNVPPGSMMTQNFPFFAMTPVSYPYPSFVSPFPPFPPFPPLSTCILSPTPSTPVIDESSESESESDSGSDTESEDNDRASQEPNPILVRIPDLPRRGKGTWQKAIAQWEARDPQLGRAISEWPPAWSRGEMNNKIAMKLRSRKIIWDEYQRLGASIVAFRQCHPYADEVPFMQLVKIIRQKNGAIQRRRKRNS
ncbi:hypothetical protein H0H93_003684 [Arthromyces matolae]|nr:hypothetical protein H0H93_003684 [Arthromyces matolae]